MTVRIHGHEYNDCDKCGHLVDANGKHYSDFLITRNCEKSARAPFPSEVGYCSNLWKDVLSA